MSAAKPEPDVAVEIASAIPGAVRVPARSVEVGDYLFDTYGGRHRVASVYRGSFITLRRDDGWPTRLAPDADITIVRGQR